MAIRTKTKRRLAILAIIAACICAAGAGIYTIRMRQIKRDLDQKLAQGIAAFDEGDYYAAMHALGMYINRADQVGSDILYKYATARRQVEEPKGKHLLQAAEILRRVLAIKPDHLQARKDLLDLYLLFRYDTEAVQTADIILRNSPDDTQALRARALALGRLRKFDEALRAAHRYNELKPLEIEGHELTFWILRKLGRPAEEMVARAEHIRDAYPDDLRGKWLVAYAYAQAGNQDEAIKWCRTVAQHDLSSDLTIRSVRLLDNLGAPREALALLRKSADRHDDPLIDRELAKRLWENGQRKELIDRFFSANAVPDYADSETLGLLAIALLKDGRRPDAMSVAEAVEDRKPDVMAVAWAGVLNNALINPPKDPSRLLDVWKEALSSAPNHPYFNYFLADTLMAIGERGRAMAVLAKAAAGAPRWPLPLVNTSRLLLQTGRREQALELAREVATRLAPGNVQAAIAWAQAWAAGWKGDPQDATFTLEQLVDQVQEAYPNEPRTLVIRIGLLARTGKAEQARKIVETVIQSEQKPSQKLLLAIADISRKTALGVEEECFGVYKQLYGTTPSLALAMAHRAASAGQADAGMELLQDAMRDSQSPDSKEWRLAIARYGEAIGQEGVAERWAGLAEDFPEDAWLQRLVLEARSVWSDMAFVDQTIERLRNIVGAESPSWRVARGRWIARQSPDERELRKAVRLLTEATTLGVDDRQVHLLLANCHQQLGNTTAAARHLRTLVDRRPEPGIEIRLAKLLYEQGDVQKANEAVQQLLETPYVTPSHLRQAALLLASMGETSTAIGAMKRIDPGELQQADLLLLAELHHRRNSPDHADIEKVRAICAKLMEKPSAAGIASVARFYASQGQAAQAAATLAKLSDIKELTPSQRQVTLGNHYLSGGDSQAAIGHYRQAIQEDPTSPIGHRLLIATYLQQGTRELALEAIRSAASQCPSDEAIKFAHQRQDLLSVVDQRQPVFIRTLAVALIQSPENRQAAAEFLQVLKQAAVAKQETADLMRKLRKLTGQYPRFWPGQAVLIRLCLATGRPDEAAEIASRAMQSFPAAPEPAWTAASAFAAAERWPEALVASKQWRKRSGGQVLAADMMIAEAYRRVGEPRSAAAQLRPHVSEAVKDPDANEDLVYSYARSMILSGEADQAAKLLTPLIAKSPNWRRRWVRLSVMALPDAQTAADWLRRVSAVTPEDATNEWLTLAQAWQTMNQRFGDPAHSKVAREILGNIMGRPNPPAGAFQLLAQIEQFLGNQPAAEAAYRKALQQDTDLALSANNLAMILLERQADLAEANTLAARAVKISPRMPDYLDTLAQIQARLGLYDAAIESMSKAVQLDAGNVEWRVNLAHLLVQTEQIERATEVAAEIDRILGGTRDNLPAPLREVMAEVDEKTAGRPLAQSPRE